MAKYVSIGQLQGEIKKSFASLKKYMDENIRAPVVSIAQQAKALADELIRRADSGEFKGDTGPRGEPGVPGETGPQGPQGEPGGIAEPVLDTDGVLQFEEGGSGGVSYLTVANGKICVIYEEADT